MTPISLESDRPEQELFRPENTYAILLGSVRFDRDMGVHGRQVRAILLSLGLTPHRILDFIDYEGGPSEQLHQVAKLLEAPGQVDILIYCIGRVVEEGEQGLSLVLAGDNVESVDVTELEAKQDRAPGLPLIAILNTIRQSGSGRRCVFILDVANSSKMASETTFQLLEKMSSEIGDVAVVMWGQASDFSHRAPPDQTSPGRTFFNVVQTGVPSGGKWLTLRDVIYEVRDRTRRGDPADIPQARTLTHGPVDLLDLWAFPNHAAQRLVQQGHSLDAAVELLVDGEFDRDSKIWLSNRLVARAIKMSRPPAHARATPDQNTVKHRLSNTELGHTFLEAFGGRAVDLVCQFSVQVLAKLWLGADLSERELIVAIGGEDPRLSLVRLMPCNSLESAQALHASSFLTLRSIEYALKDLRQSEDHEYLSEAVDLLRASKTKLSMAEKVALLVWSARPPLVMFPSPRMIPLCVPTPHIEVDADCGMLSTAGAVVYNPMGVRGVTAAFHATGPQGTRVKIGAHDCVVQRSSELYDTVFVPTPAGLNIPNLAAPAGTLISRPPWASEPVWFWGRSSGRKQTVIMGHDNGLPRARPGRQLCVQTKPETEEGDSGAGLVNGEGALVGFLFQRTEYGAPIQFSDWIWADSALGALGLSGTSPAKDED